LPEPLELIEGSPPVGRAIRAIGEQLTEAVPDAPEVGVTLISCDAAPQNRLTNEVEGALRQSPGGYSIRLRCLHFRAELTYVGLEPVLQTLLPGLVFGIDRFQELKAALRLVP
jgi:hypothetical protein